MKKKLNAKPRDIKSREWIRSQGCESWKVSMSLWGHNGPVHSLMFAIERVVELLFYSSQPRNILRITIS